MTYIPRVGAIQFGGATCSICNKINGICTLLKPKESSFLKISNSIQWCDFEYLDKNKFKYKLKYKNKISLGANLIMFYKNGHSTWEATSVKSIIKNERGHVIFRTKSTLYELYYSNFIH